jgi:REP element-mobilizing transposase RayT
MNESTWQSLAPSRWECKYHVVFVPKYRRKAVYGEIRASLGGIFHELARQKECRIVEGQLLADHVHMCIEIPPKHAVASIIGFLKGKSAVAIARQFVSGGDAATVCIDLQDNLVATAGNEPAGGVDIRLRKAPTATFPALSVRIPGLVGSTATDADNKITTENPNATTVTVTGAGFTGGGACTPPTLP